MAGEYEVQADEDSLPTGYSPEASGEPQRVTVGTSSPGKAAFTARALRSISGRVLRYDSKSGAYVPVAGAQVVLREPGPAAMTDAAGRYLFRDLAAGSYTVAVQHEAQTSARTVRLGAQPVDLKDLDFQISRPSPPDVPAPAALPAVLPVKPQPPTANPLGSRSATAQQHNMLGRQLTKAGRYREAIAELTEALRIAPDFALALNARGFALVMLHDWARAIEDLDQAILLNPSYQNAYQIRAIARRAIGDAPGGADDLRKSKQLAQ